MADEEDGKHLRHVGLLQFKESQKRNRLVTVNLLIEKKCTLWFCFLTYFRNRGVSCKGKRKSKITFQMQNALVFQLNETSQVFANVSLRDGLQLNEKTGQACQNLTRGLNSPSRSAKTCLPLAKIMNFKLVHRYLLYDNRITSMGAVYLNRSQFTTHWFMHTVVFNLLRHFSLAVGHVIYSTCLVFNAFCW